MRLLYCTRSDSPHDQRFLEVLARSGHEVYALRLFTSQEYPALNGVTNVPWEGSEGPFRLIKTHYLAGQLKTLLRNLQPDLVHAGPIQDVAFLIAQTGFHPLLTMSWGFDLMKDADLSPLSRWQTRYTLQHSDWLTMDCQATADKAIGFGFPLERICKFPWGVDLTHFSPQTSIVPGKSWRQEHGWEDKPVFLCLRSWEPNYGVDILARAFVKAAQRNPDLRLILLNSGSESGKITSILEKDGVTDKVFLGGRVPNTDLITFYGAADVYISPSHVDGSSVSLLEAMACGLPSIVSNIPANLEWIRQDENGWIYPDGDAERLSQVILASVETDLRALGQKARQDATQKADWSVNAQILLDCYEKIVASTKERVS